MSYLAQNVVFLFLPSDKSSYVDVLSSYAITFHSVDDIFFFKYVNALHQRILVSTSSIFFPSVHKFRYIFLCISCFSFILHNIFHLKRVTGVVTLYLIIYLVLHNLLPPNELSIVQMEVTG